MNWNTFATLNFALEEPLTLTLNSCVKALKHVLICACTYTRTHTQAHTHVCLCILITIIRLMQHGVYVMKHLPLGNCYSCVSCVCIYIYMNVCLCVCVCWIMPAPVSRTDDYAHSALAKESDIFVTLCDFLWLLAATMATATAPSGKNLLKK